jgi:uncharacterized membrane protein SirB2
MAREKTRRVIEFYPEILFVHITAAFASGGLFLLRGLALYLGGRWALATPLSVLGYSIDTVLLTAALMLMTIVAQYPFVHDWLTVKVLLLIVYLVLGMLALRSGGTLRTRVICWLAGLVVFGFTISVARAHDPLGIFSSFVR